MDGGTVQTTPAPGALDFDAVHGLSPLDESLARPAMPASGTVARPHRGLPATLSTRLGSPSAAVLTGWREIVAGFDAVENRVPIDELVPNRKPRSAKDRLILYYHDGSKRTRELLRARFEAPPTVPTAVDADAAEDGPRGAAISGDAVDDMVIGDGGEEDSLVTTDSALNITPKSKPNQSGRRLTPGERALAQSVFGHSINYDAVRVYPHPYPWALGMHPKGRLMAPNGNIYFGPGMRFIADFSRENFEWKSRFIHEMAHVWQHNQKIEVWLALLEHIRDPLFGGNPYRYLPLEPVKHFTEYEIEEQAQIVEDYFRLLRNHKIKRGLQDPKEQVPSILMYERLIPFVTKFGE